jgi:nucleosome assembly protein 1-like 1
MADNTPEGTIEIDQNDGRGFQPVDDVAAGVEGIALEDELANLPKKVQLRVTALRALQDQQAKIEEEFEKERKLLELKYEKLYQPLYAERAEIVSGTKEVDAVVSGEGLSAEEIAEDVKGVPGFWVRALMNHSALAEMVQERDLQALEFLIDVRSTSHETDNGFKLEFVFAENPVFSNKVLTKEYDIGEASESGEAVLRNVIGTPIEWKDGQNLCEVTKKVKQRAKGSKETRVVSRTEPCDSFFQFFTPVEMPSEDDEDVRTAWAWHEWVHKSANGSIVFAERHYHAPAERRL